MVKSGKNLLFVCCIVLSPFARAQSDPAEASILATVDAFFVALANRDRESLEALSVPGPLNISASVDADGTSRFSSRNYDELIAALSSPSANKPLERYWDATVLVRGDIAVFWAPYDFHVGSQFSHCGVDSFQLIRRQGKWLITNLSWTSERDACPESPLGPVGQN
jgi:hypothetical protein